MASCRFIDIQYVEPSEDPARVNSNNLLGLRPYCFYDEEGMRFEPPSVVEKGQARCAFCFHEYATFSELYKHTARPCHETLPLSGRSVVVSFAEHRLPLVEDALAAIGLQTAANPYAEVGGDTHALSFRVDTSLLELTLRRLYLASCTKYNLDRYYEPLAALGLTPSSSFLPLDSGHLKLVRALVSTALASSLGMATRLSNAELQARQDLEQLIDTHLSTAFPQETIPPLFLKFTTRSPKDAIATAASSEEDEKTLSREQLMRRKVEALLVRSGEQALELLSRSQRVFADIDLFAQYGLPNTSSAGLGLVFRTFLPDIRPELEFRCFVAEGRRMTAMSQYNCFDRFQVLQDAALVHRIADAIIAAHERVRLSLPPSLPYYVADFAVLGDPSDPLLPVRLSLLELNPFGPDLSSGSALFHWQDDHDLLMGLIPGAPLQVRILKAE